MGLTTGLKVGLAVKPGANTECCGCKGTRFETVFTYHKPPAIETRLPLGENEAYYREYARCTQCGHMSNFHTIDLDKIYEGAYVDSTYGDGDGMLRTFNKIISLPPDQSDNSGRVKRIERFASAHFDSDAVKKITLLDVGSGLGVFPYGIKRLGWDCTALDPDPRATSHIESVVGVSTLTGDFMAMNLANSQKFDIVCFNKVLEHVKEPVAMLERTSGLVHEHGFVYVEVPDVAASAEGKEREEFTIDHYHVFSPASLALLAERAGFSVLSIERLREPSSKYTLRLFAAPALVS